MTVLETGLKPGTVCVEACLAASGLRQGRLRSHGEFPLRRVSGLVRRCTSRSIESEAPGRGEPSKVKF
ncbi:hypothetical protein STXM2123_5347 [Streptomyces sp. F-3]|nr:hypothetical protein STXM2123_5347 [Streptomyces sp. F-3]